MMTELKGGIKTLWLRFDANSTDQHQLFYKEHSIRNQPLEYPKGQTLFVLNIPPWANSNALRNSFSNACGEVKSITLLSNTEDNPRRGFSTAYIVFERELSLDKALSLPQDFTLTLYEGNGDHAIGIAKWYKEYNATVSCDEAITKKVIEEYMQEYDEKVAQRLTEGDNDNEEVDEDGWVTVSNKKKRGQFAPARKESTIGKLQGKEERKNRKKELINFYTFQIRESKKQNLVELRKKFELDKKKLQQLKSKRSFKPF